MLKGEWRSGILPLQSPLRPFRALLVFFCRHSFRRLGLTIPQCFSDKKEHSLSTEEHSFSTKEHSFSTEERSFSTEEHSLSTEERSFSMPERSFSSKASGDDQGRRRFAPEPRFSMARWSMRERGSVAAGGFGGRGFLFLEPVLRGRLGGGVGIVGIRFP